jgi:hypothetical protein
VDIKEIAGRMVPRIAERCGKGRGDCHGAHHRNSFRKLTKQTMSITPEQLYLQLGKLVAEMPDLATGPITPEVNKCWAVRPHLLT